MKRQRAAWWAALPLLSVLLASPAAGGGYTEIFDITGRVPPPDGGAGFLARAVPIRWDERCMPVPIRINDTLDPIPNPLDADFLTVADAAAALDRSLATWNAVPGSFFRFELVGTSSNPGPIRLDFVNEVVFRAPTVSSFARTIAHAMMEDLWLEDGEDIDGDGDPDVVAGLDRCRDADGDGDHELPAGFYPAGTILDADIELNTADFRFTVSDAAVDTNPHSVDLQALLTHELGHVHGLAHSLTNQIGPDDGRPATLFALLDSGDPADELAWRRLSLEDMASTAFHYPEGSAATGAAALSPGEIPFDELYGVIEGEVRHSRTGLPLAGGSVFAEDEARLLVEAAAGTADLADMVERRAAGIPLEHVVGWAEFCGLRLAVDPGVFVPRHRSELLVREAAARAPAGAVVVDLCCGSGAVGVAVAAALGDVELHAADVDPAAVRCARRNVGPAGGTVYEGDLLDALPARLRGRVDVLVANVPYVPTDAVALLPPEARLHDREDLQGDPQRRDVTQTEHSGDVPAEVQGRREADALDRLVRGESAQMGPVDQRERQYRDQRMGACAYDRAGFGWSDYNPAPRTLEQQVNASDLPDDVKVKLQSYVSGCYGSLTSFNVLFADEADQFTGSSGGDDR